MAHAFACWIIKATGANTHTEYVILITLPLQQWLLERALHVYCLPLLQEKPTLQM